MSDTDDPHFETLTAVLDACGRLNSQEQLLVLEVAWLTVAGMARNAQIFVPGGFPAELARQLTTLRSMADLIAGDVPDLELERLHQEGDLAGVLARMRQLWGRADEASDDDEKGGA